MATLREIAPFREGGDFNDWKRWKDEIISLLNIKFGWTPQQKLAYLQFAGGHGIRRLLRQLPPLNPPGVGLHVSIAEPDPFDDAMDRLDEYFLPGKNVMAAVAEFRSTRQEINESAKDFAIRLRENIDKCDYMEDEREANLKEQFLIGCRDVKLRRQAALAGFPSMREAVEYATLNETLKQQEQQPTQVNALQQPQPRCRVCHQTGHVAAKCRQGRKLRTCYACGKPGHFARSCPEQRREVTGANSGRYQPYWKAGGNMRRDGVHAVEVEEFTEDVKPPVIVQFLGGGDEVTCEVEGVRLSWLVDSGCQANIITKKALQLLNARGKRFELKPQDREFKAYATLEPLKMEGMFEATISFDGMEERAPIYVSAQGQCCLLGNQTAKRLGIYTFKKNVSN